MQEFAGKVDSLRDLGGTEWHLIGHLQSNKAARAAELFAAVDSVDSVKPWRKKLKLLAAAELGKTLPVLIEINVGGEEAKSGVAMGSGELGKILIGVDDWKNLAVRGLMTVPPYTEDPEGSRHYFRRLREIRENIAARRLPGVSMDVLSMGMSHDFVIAIEEGSTCVRVGDGDIWGTATALTKEVHREETTMDSAAAKQFLDFRKVIDEAAFENVPLSDIEKTMLQFSEAHPSLPDLYAVNAEFERDYDADEYENKITGLLKRRAFARRVRQQMQSRSGKLRSKA